MSLVSRIFNSTTCLNTALATATLLFGMAAAKIGFNNAVQHSFAYQQATAQCDERSAECDRLGKAAFQRADTEALEYLQATIVAKRRAALASSRDQSL